MAQTESDSLSRTASQVSIGFPERSSSQSGSKPSGPSHAGPLASDKNLPAIDQCCIGMFCSTHEKLLLANLKNKGIYIPNFVIRSTDSWQEIASTSIRHIIQSVKLNNLSIVIPEQLINIIRLQLPRQYPHYMIRVTYVIAISHDDNDTCGQNESLYFWNSLDELIKSETLWGIEPIEIFRFLKQLVHQSKSEKKSISFPITIIEYNQKDATKFIGTSSEFQKEKELLLSAKYTVEELLKLYNEFVLQCFPSQFMTFHSFKIFLNKVGWVNDEEILYRMVFYSFTASIEDSNFKQKNLPAYLTFDQLIIGLAVMEEQADHRANCLKFRLRYIFNFYDLNQDGQLSPQEIHQMVIDIKKKPMTHEGGKSEISLSVNEVRKNVAELLHRLGDSNNFITYEQFVKSADSERDSSWIAELTETLFRSNTSTIEVASVKFDYKNEAEPSNVLRAMILMNNYEEVCEQCPQTNFNVCIHAISIDEHGLIRGTIKFDLCPLYKDTPFIQELPVKGRDFSIINEELRRLSLIAVNVFCASGSKINLCRQTSREIKSNTRLILKLAKEIIKKESLVIRCESPCMIVSELWSNIQKIHSLMSSINRMSPFVNPMNLIFLGNYMDPNSPLGIELLIYLLCFKVLVPKKIFLLRGPNECRRVLRSKTVFSQECIDMFGQDIYTEILDILDMLPFVAILDDRLFLSKSGIPTNKIPISKIESLNPKEKTPISRLNNEFKNITQGQLLRKSKEKLVKNDKKTRKGKSSSRSTSKSSAISEQQPQQKTDSVKRKTRKSKKVKSSSSIKTKESRVKKTKRKISKGSMPSNTDSNTLSRIGFTAQCLRRFMRCNNFTHFIRSDHRQNIQRTMVSCQGSMITLVGIGQPNDNGRLIQTQGTVAVADRYKIRIVRL